MENNLIDKKTEKFKEPVPIEDFDLKKYMGVWYEKARTPNFFQKTEAINTTAEYALLDNGKVSVTNSSLFENKERKINGEAKIFDKENIGDLSLTFGKNFFSKWLMRGRYKIVKTDYENFSFLYIKTNYFFFWSKIYAWILTRDPNPKEEVMEDYIEDFTNLTGLKREDLIFCKNNLNN